MTAYAKWGAGGLAATIAIAFLAWFISANQPANRCFEFYQEKAGATLKLVSSERVGASTWITVAAGSDEIRSTAVCQFQSDGKVDRLGTDLAWITKLTDETIACLEKNSKLWIATEGKFAGQTQDCGEEAISRRSRWLRIFNDGELSATFGRR